jgi:hypothetical protein
VSIVNSDMLTQQQLASHPASTPLQPASLIRLACRCVVCLMTPKRPCCPSSGFSLPASLPMHSPTPLPTRLDELLEAIAPKLNRFIRSAFSGYEYSKNCTKCLTYGFSSIQYLSPEVPRAMTTWWGMWREGEGGGGAGGRPTQTGSVPPVHGTLLASASGTICNNTALSHLLLKAVLLTSCGVVGSVHGLHNRALHTAAHTQGQPTHAPCLMQTSKCCMNTAATTHMLD